MIEFWPSTHTQVRFLRRIFGSTRMIMMALVAMLPMLCAFQSNDAEAPSTEYLIKAAFVYNFAQFVDWPAEAFPRNDSPIIIGILGSDPFSAAVTRSIQDKTAKGRPFVVRRLGMEPAVKECHILVVSASEARRFDKLMKLINGAPVLTIGESNGFARNGGIINLVLENGKTRMEINVGAANQARLNISSKLLSLAKIVQ